MTIIAGANSSGKSSFMQPFMILKQTLENNSDGQALIINGENANLTESQQIFCKKNKSKKSFSLSWENFNKKKEVIESSKIEFGYTSKEGFTAFEASNNDITIKKGMSLEELEMVLEPFKEKEGFLKEIFQSMKSENKLIPRLKTEKSFLCVEMVPEKFLKKRQHIFSFGITPAGNIQDFVEKLIHIPGIRSNPERQYKIERYNKKYQGRFDKYTASIIYNWGEKENKKLEELISIIKELGLASNITAKKINEAHISLHISRHLKSNRTDTVDLSDVGFGLSQVLPILIAVIEANKDNIIYIEQPEIHLHPLAQYKLANILCRYVKKGKKIIIETHSSIFIRGLQTEVAKKNISSNEFSLNWFSQNETGETSIFESEIDEFGAFGDWPADFDDVYLEADTNYLNAVEERLS